MEHWDLIIIGAGPAGITAGIYGARSGLKTLILEEKTPGGAAAESPLIENYPGFPAISGGELIKKMVEHCQKFRVTINELEAVVELDLKGEGKIVKTDRASYMASAVIMASGCHYRELGATGENEFRGRGVSYCAVCDGAFFKGKRVIVVGGGNSAAVSAIYLSNLASDVKLAHRRDQLRAEEALVKDLQERKVEFLWNTEIKEIKGDIKVKSVVIFNNKTGEIKEIEADGIFVQVGEVPNSQIAKAAGVQVDKDGYIIVDARQRTNVHGVYAAGDVTTGPVKQIGTAVGQAIVAATEAFGYIKRPYYYKA
ncbi:MAG: Sulfide dehydrogenase subunit alpha precursor [Candidatus Bathyarchaeota archaeon BA1]|nr:MAG: Sulfide dehydrogenase subunit alpha precursor [Candidatus Bathyarchaeota archaeon BA1]